MLLSCETVRISSPAFYKDPPLRESQFRSPSDVEINSLASFDAAPVKDLFMLLPARLGCSARLLGLAARGTARHSSKAAWRLGSPARHGGALRQLATRGAATQRGGHGGVAPWLGSARRRSDAAPRLGGAVRGGVAAWWCKGFLGLARLGSAPRLGSTRLDSTRLDSTRPRVGSAARQLGRAAALRRTARRLCDAAALRRGAASTAPPGFVVLICFKKKRKPD